MKMSGGRWNYQDQKIDAEIKVEQLPKLLQGLQQCFHLVDWAESGDSSKKDVQKRIYEILLKLGNDLWEEP